MTAKLLLIVRVLLLVAPVVYYIIALSVFQRNGYASFPAWFEWRVAYLMIGANFFANLSAKLKNAFICFILSAALLLVPQFCAALIVSGNYHGLTCAILLTVFIFVVCVVFFVIFGKNMSVGILFLAAAISFVDNASAGDRVKFFTNDEYFGEARLYLIYKKDGKESWDKWKSFVLVERKWKYWDNQRLEDLADVWYIYVAPKNDAAIGFRLDNVSETVKFFRDGSKFYMSVGGKSIKADVYLPPRKKKKK